MKTTTWFLLSVSVLLSRPTHSAADDLYDEAVLRTLQLEFSQRDWWSQLQANYKPTTSLRVGGRSGRLQGYKLDSWLTVIGQVQPKGRRGPAPPKTVCYLPARV